MSITIYLYFLSSSLSAHFKACCMTPREPASSVASSGGLLKGAYSPYWLTSLIISSLSKLGSIDDILNLKLSVLSSIIFNNEKKLFFSANDLSVSYEIQLSGNNSELVSLNFTK